MATHFERQLEELHVQMITMGSLCEKVISLSNRAIRGEMTVSERSLIQTERSIQKSERSRITACVFCFISSLWQEICERFQQH